jgi:signal transduction histidine kinase
LRGSFFGDRGHQKTIHKAAGKEVHWRTTRLRTSSWSSPPETENGLIPALRDLLDVAVPDSISAELSTSGAESRPSDHQRGQLYLILSETVRNAVRHSGCRSLTVGLDITSENVSGYVEDDGETQSGLGLNSIRERAELMEGTAEVYPSQKGGAGVQVCLPLRNGGGQVG